MALSEDGIFSEWDWNHISHDLAFSHRQMEIARHLFLGRSDKQIASALGIKSAIVRTHLNRLYSKVQVQDRNELVLLCVRHYFSQCADCERHNHRPGRTQEPGS